MNSRAYELLQEGRRLLDVGADREAVPLLELASLLQPHKGSILEALGQAYFNDRKLGKARIAFEEALEVDPTNHWAHYCLSLCLSRLGGLAEAVGHIKLALVMEPSNQSYGELLRRLRFRQAMASGA